MAPLHSRFAFALASAAAATYTVTAGAAPACEASTATIGIWDAAAACTSKPRHATHDHVLLQSRSSITANSSQHLHRTSVPASCQAQSVRRRRRNEAMRSCRRRHSSAGYDDTDSPEAMWTCDEQQNRMVCDPSKTPQEMGYPGTGTLKAAGLWCSVPKPPQNWNLKSCPLSEGTPKITVKVLTYNLFWWNLFDQKGGSGRSAGKLIAQTGKHEQYDIMAFQECDDRYRVIRDAKLEGLPGEWEAIDGGRAVAIAYLKSRWTLKDHGSQDVGEDDAHQHYGKRTAQWVRLQHTDGKVVFFVNHHGPLPVGWGGGCTGSAAAFNILRAIADHAHEDDAIVLVGDFNAEADSSRIKELDTRLNRVFSGTEMGGVDHVFTNCAADAQGKNLGKGNGKHGSDHDALSVTFKF